MRRVPAAGSRCSPVRARPPAIPSQVLILPNGRCAILAAEGNEKYLILPSVLFVNNANVDADDAAGALEALPLTRSHPLDVLVDLGVPGVDGDVAVLGLLPDPCAPTGTCVNGWGPDPRRTSVTWEISNHKEVVPSAVLARAPEACVPRVVQEVT